MRKTAYINVRVEEKTKEEVERVLDRLGINMSTAIDLYLNQIKLKQGLPFKVNLPKTTTNDKVKNLAEALNLTGGQPYPKKFQTILSLYARGEIDFEVAMYAIKKEYING